MDSSNSQADASALNLDNARNLVELLRLREADADREACVFKQDGQWKKLLWKDQLARIRNIALGLRARGIGRGDNVAIFADTRLEWILSALATFTAGASIVPVYGSDTAAEISYILGNSKSVAIIIDHDVNDVRHKMAGRLTRLREAKKNLPDLKHVILFDPPPDSQGIELLDQVEADGARQEADDPGAGQRLLVDSAEKTGPDDTAFLLYTSGTTGNPKGVMLTHSNWVSQARAVFRSRLLGNDEMVLLFLPLAHAFALIAFVAHIGFAVRIAYAESIDKAIDNAAETDATLMTCVPRVMEKAYNKVVSDGASQTGVKGQVFRWAMSQFDEYAADVIAGKEHNTLQWKLAQTLVFTQIQAKIEARFGRTMKKFVSGGAPLAKKIGIFFEMCGFHVCEGYGLTETCAPTHVNLPIPGKSKIGTVGLPWEGVQVRIAEDGELLMKGPQIMKGYFNMPEATAAAIDEEGWFHTGDIGEVDADGFLTITDRKKDLLKTSGGKYIAPQELESGLKTEPLVGNLLIVGDRRKFVSALITLDPGALKDFCARSGLPTESFAEMSQFPEVKKKIDGAVKALNDRLPGFATIKKFAILDHVWTQQDGTITPTLKVKRKEVLKRYVALIDGFYGGEHFD